MVRKATNIASQIVEKNMSIKKAFQYAIDNYPLNYRGPGHRYTREEWTLIVMEQVNEIANSIYNL